MAAGPSKICAKCEKSIYPNDPQLALGECFFHKSCARCATCNGVLSIKNFTTSGDRLLCKTHFKEEFSQGGGVYNEDKFKRRSSSILRNSSILYHSRDIIPSLSPAARNRSKKDVAPVVEDDSASGKADNATVKTGDGSTSRLEDDDLSSLQEVDEVEEHDNICVLETFSSVVVDAQREDQDNGATVAAVEKGSEEGGRGGSPRGDDSSEDEEGDFSESRRCIQDQTVKEEEVDENDNICALRTFNSMVSDAQSEGEDNIAAVAIVEKGPEDDKRASLVVNFVEARVTTFAKNVDFAAGLIESRRRSLADMDRSQEDFAEGESYKVAVVDKDSLLDEESERNLKKFVAARMNTLSKNIQFALAETGVEGIPESSSAGVNEQPETSALRDESVAAEDGEKRHSLPMFVQNRVSMFGRNMKAITSFITANE